MANFDTIAFLVGGTGRGQIKAGTVTDGTETLFVVNTDTAGTTQVATLAVPTGDSTHLVGSASPSEFNQNASISSQSYGRKSTVFTAPPFFSTSTFDAGRPFRVRISGTASVPPTAVTANPNTVLVEIYNGTALTATFKIATLTAGLSNNSTTATVTGQFALEAFVQWDSTTQTLSGLQSGNLGNTAKTPAALSNAVAVTSASKLIFTPAFKFDATAAVGGTVNVAEFSIEQV